VQKRTILVVEDNSLVREMVSDLLQEFHPDWRIITATNGLEGVAAVESNHPDLIIFNLQMPVMNGYEMVLRLQAQPETRDIPLILSTGEIEEHPLVKRLSTVCRAILNQPFSPQELELVVNTAFDQPPAP